MTSHRSTLRNENGLALFAVLLLLVMFLSLSAASIFTTALDLKSTTHYATGNQALHVAESGIIHALNVLNTRSIWDLGTQSTDNKWSDPTTGVFDGVLTLPNNPNLRYFAYITPDPDVNLSIEQGVITAIGTGLDNSGRVLQVAIRKSDLSGALSAIFLSNPNPNPTFNGDKFIVSGHDVDLLGNQTGYISPAIATQDDAAAATTITAIGAQTDQITGLGENPSVLPTGGPLPEDYQAIAEAIFLQDPAPFHNQVFNGATDLKGINIGTSDEPWLTWVKGDCTLNGSGSPGGVQMGYGFLYCEGSCKLNGSAEFTGWVMCRDGNEMLNGNFTMTGMLWTGEIDTKFGGSMVANFSMAAIQTYASQAFAKFPRKMRVTTWQELGYNDLPSDVQDIAAGMLGKSSL